MSVAERLGQEKTPGAFFEKTGFKVLAEVTQTRDEDIRAALLEHIEQSAAFQAERQRIQAEANRKMAEAAYEQENRSNQYTKTKVEVEPQSEATPAKPKRDSSQDKDAKTSTAKAKTIGVSRAAVERAATIQRKTCRASERGYTGKTKAQPMTTPIEKPTRPKPSPDHPWRIDDQADYRRWLAMQAGARQKRTS